MAQPSSPLQEPVNTKLEKRCFRSTLKEFFDPLKTNNPRTDFYNMYRRESQEYDQDYARPFEDLNTLLIFAGLFSAVSSAFIINIESNLQPDPNEMTAVYLQILIHSMNNSLFPDASPNSIAWAGPPPDIVAVQAILYASLAISLLAAFLAILGKQWINRYTHTRGGSTEEKSRNRQRKLDGLEDWYFHVIAECLPAMLQLALLLLGCALSRYLWTISHTIAWIAVTFTIFGFTSYTFFTLAATFYNNCPYQTPFSLLIQALIRDLTHRRSTFARLARSGIRLSFLLYSHSAGKLRRALRNIRARARIALRSLGCVFGAPGNMELLPTLAAMEPPIWNFGEISADLETYKGDVRCIAWIFRSAIDRDIIFCAAQFAAEITLYPETVNAVEPHILANHFLGCLEDGQVIHDRLGHTSVIGLALASVLSVKLCMDPTSADLQDLSRTIHTYADWIASSEPTFLLGVVVLGIVSQNPERAQGGFPKWEILSDIPVDLPVARKLSLSRTMLQTIWRWRRVQGPKTVLNLKGIDSFCRGLVADSDHVLPATRTNCFLIMAFSLGGPDSDIRTLFTPNTDDALRTAIALFNNRLQLSIQRNIEQRTLTSVLSALVYLNPFQVLGTGEWGFLWIAKILESRYPENERYQTAGQVVQLLEKYFRSEDRNHPIDLQSTWIPSLASFLSLYEKFYTVGSPTSPRSLTHSILSTSPVPSDFNTTILPLLTLTLSPTHPLRLRTLALRTFYRVTSGWFSLRMEKVSDADLRNLLQAVGDPLDFTPDPPLHDNQPSSTTVYDPMIAAVVLIEFASSDLWRNHLQQSNFALCENSVSTEEGRKAALGCMTDTAADAWREFLHTSSKVSAAVSRLEELHCPKTAQVVNEWAMNPQRGAYHGHHPPQG